MGPLAGVKIVEFTGIGPAPMAAMLLADMGATVLRIDRVAPSDLGVPVAEEHEFTRRSRAVLNLDLKRPEAIDLALRLIDGVRRADRRVPARRHGASGPRPRRLSWPQPEAGLRAGDWLGAGGSAGAGRRA